MTGVLVNAFFFNLLPGPKLRQMAKIDSKIKIKIICLGQSTVLPLAWQLANHTLEYCGVALSVSNQIQ